MTTSDQKGHVAGLIERPSRSDGPDELLMRLDKKRAARLMAMCRKIAMDQIWEDQGGSPHLSADGKWLVAGSCVTLSPDDLDLVFELTGIAKSPIVSRGHCQTCVYARNGQERGYKPPCISCKRPIMSNYEPRNRRIANPTPGGGDG